MFARKPLKHLSRALVFGSRITVLCMMFSGTASAQLWNKLDSLSDRTIRVASAYGSVEHKILLARAFIPLSSSTVFVNAGDRLRTGAGATLTLELPDGVFIVVPESSTLTVQLLVVPNARNLLKVVLGRIRFTIQRLGGRSNSYGVGAATALIAVRG